MKERLIRIMATLLLLAIYLSCSERHANAQQSQKPQLPLQIRIAPVLKSVKQKDIQPGDTVALTVTAVSQARRSEMLIQIELLEGTELVTGDLSWKGVLAKRGKKQMGLSVRAPVNGVGKVHAKIFIIKNGEQHLARETTYLLGSSSVGAEKNAEKPAGIDSKGRAVKEYR